MRQKPRLPSMISSETVEALLGQQRRQQAVRRRLAGVERLAHGAAVLLHAGRLRRGDAERIRHLLRIEAEQPPAAAPAAIEPSVPVRCQPPS